MWRENTIKLGESQFVKEIMNKKCLDLISEVLNSQN